MQVAEVGFTFSIEVNPQLQSFDLQIFQVDVSVQVKRIEILDSHGGQQPIDLAELLTALGVIELDAKHLDSLRTKCGVESFDFGAHAVRRQSVLDLSRDISIDVPEAISKQPDEHQRRDSDDNQYAEKYRVPPCKQTPLARSAATVVCRFETLSDIRFHPPGSGSVPSGSACGSPGTLNRSRRSPR